MQLLSYCSPIVNYFCKFLKKKKEISGGMSKNLNLKQFKFNYKFLNKTKLY